MAKYILILSFFISLAIRLYFILTGKHVGDVHLIYMMASTFAEGRNPYLVYDYYVYGPLAIFLERFCIILSGIIPIPFHMITKFFPNLADFLTAIVLFRFFIKLKVKEKKAAIWASIFILNPISILLSAAHAQLDSIFSLFVLVSLYFLIYKRPYLSALLLGISIAIKPNPIMLLPLFITFRRSNLKDKIIYLLIAAAPLTITFTPFLLEDPLKAIIRVAGYSGISDLGFSAILRGIWYQINGSIQFPLVNEVLSANKLAFLFAYAVIILIFSLYKKITRAIITVYLAFLALFFGISAQYLVWLIPFAILERNKMVIFYIFFGTFALVGFYLFLAQNILLGTLSTEASFQVKHIYLYFYGNLFFQLFNVCWLIKILLTDGKIQFSKFSNARKYAIYAFSVLFLLSLLPLFKILNQIMTQFSQNI